MNADICDLSAITAEIRLRPIPSSGLEQVPSADFRDPSRMHIADPIKVESYSRIAFTAANIMTRRKKIEYGTTCARGARKL